MYKVLIRFKDLQDNNHLYLPGDTFPREGLEVSESRIKQLSSTNNRRGVAAIEEIKPVKAEPKPEPKPEPEPVIANEPQEHKRRGRRKRVN